MVILAKLGGEDGPKGMAEWLKFRIDFLVSQLKLRRVSVPNQGHGRFERRTLAVCGVQAGELDWPYARQVFKLQRRFTQINTGQVSEETVFGITSLPAEQADARRLLEINRGYWGIENGLHHRRDVTLKTAGRMVCDWLRRINAKPRPVRFESVMKWQQVVHRGAPIHTMPSAHLSPSTRHQIR